MWFHLLDQRPLFKWYMTRFVINNEHQRETHCHEFGLCIQNVDTILDSIIITIGPSLCGHLKRENLEIGFLELLHLNFDSKT